MPAAEHIVLASIAYMMGSFPSAVLVCHFMGLPDPRQHGSGNPGATNVLRLGNRIAATLTLLLDIAKGLAAVWLAHSFNVDSGIIAIIAFAVVLGHAFPLPNGRRGGKGVATSLGVLLALSPILGVILLGFWAMIACCMRLSSLASVCTAILAPFLGYLMAPNYTTAFCIISLVLLYTHRENIKRLIAGTEAKF